MMRTRMRTATRAGSFGLTVALCAGLVACAPATADRGAPRQVIVIEEQQEPDSLNPIISNMMASVDAMSPVFSGLVQVDNKMHFFPDLALQVPTLENGLVKLEGKGMTVTFHLRHARWSDGVPITSKDVVFTWKVEMNPTVMASSRDGFDRITRIDTPDPYTAIVHFKSIYAPYLNLWGTILPEHLLAKAVAEQDRPGDSHFNHCKWNRHPIGSGPFKIKDWVSGDHITYVPNPYYYGRKPKLKELIMKFVPDQNSAFIQLESGDIDIYQSAAITQYDQLKSMPGIRVLTTPALEYDHLDFNTRDPILKDPVVRRAMAYAINDDKLSKIIYKGLYTPAYGDQSPLNKLYFNPAIESMYPYDPAKAKQILEADGWKPGPDGIRAKDGKRLSFTIVTTAGMKPRELTERVAQYYLRKVGIRLNIENVQADTLFGRPDGLLNTGKYQIALFAWISSPDPDDVFLWNSHQFPPNGENDTYYSNPEVDRLTVAGDSTINLAKREAIYKRIQYDLWRDMPMLSLLNWTAIDAINDRVGGFRPNPTSAGNLWNTQDWYVKE